MTETPQYDLTIFKVHFGLLTLKGYTKGERVLRFEAIVHNTKELGCGRAVDKFPTIVAKLAAMVHRFCTMLDCVDVVCGALRSERQGRMHRPGSDLQRGTCPRGAP